MTAKPKMPEPTGDYAKVPKGWPPQTWGAHLANLHWMTEMNRAHFSRTDAKWHIDHFKKAVIEEERERCAKIVAAAGVCVGCRPIQAALVAAIRKGSG